MISQDVLEKKISNKSNLVIVYSHLESALKNSLKYTRHILKHFPFVSAGKNLNVRIIAKIQLMIDRQEWKYNNSMWL